MPGGLVPDELISADARSKIGYGSEPQRGVVDRKEFQRWAASLNDLNPLYFDENAAKAQGHRGLVMPPMFLNEALNDVVYRRQLRPDGGLSGRIGVDLPLPGRRMAGGEQTEFYLPVCHGDELVVTSSVVGIEEKIGRSGRFVVVTSEKRYVNGDGALVARSRSQTIAR
jgi:acyl dehydratase